MPSVAGYKYNADKPISSGIIPTNNREFIPASTIPFLACLLDRPACKRTQTSVSISHPGKYATNVIRIKAIPGENSIEVLFAFGGITRLSNKSNGLISEETALMLRYPIIVINKATSVN